MTTDEVIGKMRRSGLGVRELRHVAGLRDATLTFATTRELFEEIARRHDVAILSASSGDEVLWMRKGTLPACVGVSALVADSIAAQMNGEETC